MKNFTRWLTVVLMAAVAFSCSSVDLQEEMEQVTGVSQQAVTRAADSYGLRKITGRVTDENNEPLVGANIQVVGNTQGVMTDCDGNFTLYAENSDILYVSYIGYRPLRVPVMSQTVFKIKLTDNSVLDGGPITESSLPVIEFSGTVKDLDGNPLPGVEVQTNIRGGSAAVYTDQDGKFSTKGSLITYVSYRKDGYDCQIWRITENMPLVVYMVPVDLPIDITGTVTDFYGLPAGGVKVQEENSSACTYTSTDGTYRITAPKNGRLVFSKTGYINTSEHIFEKKTLDARINNETVTVTGDVKSGGNPLPGVTVTVQGTPISTTTSATGYYSIRAPYKSCLEFSKFGYYSVTKSSLEPVMDIDMNSTTPPTPSTRPITGTIKDEFGEPLIGATVLQEGTVNGNCSDLEGRYSLTVPSDPKIILRFEYLGYIPQEIVVGDRYIINVVLEEEKWDIE